MLMIMASHQTFSGQLKHLTGQTKFGQSNILYIINGKVIKFLIEKSMSRQFSILIISTGIILSLACEYNVALNLYRSMLHIHMYVQYLLGTVLSVTYVCT